jgi:sugar lactone lactonase YvrE
MAVMTGSPLGVFRPLAFLLLVLSVFAFDEALAGFEWSDLASEATGRASLVFAFQNSTFIENLRVLPDGKILFTELESGTVRIINPEAKKSAPRALVSLPGTTGLTGIAPLINPEQYAITGGLHSQFAFEYGSMKLFIVNLSGQIIDTIPVPDTSMMNGLATLPSHGTTLLSADSLTGRILRIDIATRKWDVAFSDPALGPPEGSGFPLGANGIRVRNGFLYFANSGRGTFGRIAIDKKGNKVGKVEIIATLPSPPSMSNAYDDFDFDTHGNAYIALHSSAVMKVTPSGCQTLFAGGPSTDPCDPNILLREPTSVALGRSGTYIYVSTGGNIDYDCPQVSGGQIYKIALEG